MAATGPVKAAVGTPVIMQLPIEFPPWSVGTNRLEFGANGGVGSRFGLSAALAAQGQRSTELISAFRDLPLYRQSGVATVVQILLPGEGVRNAADLAALRQAERRFGNGDRLFTAEEQQRAFEAAHRFLLAAQSPGGTLRRLRFGLELHF